MAIIETKFSIGDIVWHASIKTERRSHPCPDCMGSRKWEARSPAGGIFQAPCPRCASSYRANVDLALDYSWWEPSALRLTIGLVRACNGSNGEHQYMAHETGIGSGSLYYEERLFPTEEDALKCAQAMANVNNAEPAGWVAKQYAGSLRFCDYELKDAVVASAEARAKDMAAQAEYLIADVADAQNRDEIKAAVERWRERQTEAA